MTVQCTKEDEFKDIEICLGILKTRWKALGVGLTILLSIITIWLKLGINSTVNAQTEARAEATAVAQKNSEQDESINDLEKAVVVIQNDMNHIKEDVADIKGSNDSILEGINELKNQHRPTAAASSRRD